MVSDNEAKPRRNRHQVISDDSDNGELFAATNRRNANRRLVYVSDGELNPTRGLLDDVQRNWSEGDQIDSDDDDDSLTSADEAEDGTEKDGGANDNNSSSDSDGESDKCPICLSRYKEQQIGSPESCDHCFCLECILEWSKKVTTCPVDRQKYSLILVRDKPEGKITRRIPVDKCSAAPTAPDEPEAASSAVDLTVCEICGNGDHEESLLLCDGCDLAYHCQCLDPPLDHVPIEEWFCSYCTNRLGLTSQAESVSRRIQASMQPVIRRVIARTRASETVRQRIIQTRRQRATSSQSSATTRKPTTKKTVRRKRKTYTKRKSKTTKRRTKSTRRRRRKGARKTSKSSKYVKIPSIRQRVAQKLGICRSKGPRHSLPMINKSKAYSFESNANSNAPAVFGERYDTATNYEAYDSSDEEYEVRGGGRIGLIGRTASARTSHARQMAKQGLLNVRPSSTSTADDTNRIVAMNSGPADLLGAILQGQSVLLSSSQDLQLKRDGSLKSLHSNNINLPSSSSSAKKTAAGSNGSPKSPKSPSKSQSPAKDQSQTSVASSEISSSGDTKCRDASSEKGDDGNNGGSILLSSPSEPLPKQTKRKTDRKIKDDDDDGLYSDIESADGEVPTPHIPNYGSMAADSGNEVEPSYSPVIGSDASDEELVIDEPKKTETAPDEDKTDENIVSSTVDTTESPIMAENPRLPTNDSHQETKDGEDDDEDEADQNQSEKINETSESESDFELPNPMEMDFQLCKDDVYESPPPNSEIRNIQDMLSPVSAAASSSKGSDDEDVGHDNNESEQEELIIQEKTHSKYQSSSRSQRVDASIDQENANWKKLSRSTKVRSYRDGKPKDRDTYFQDRDIKKRQRSNAESARIRSRVTERPSKRSNDSRAHGSEHENQSKKARRDRIERVPSKGRERQRSLERYRHKRRHRSPDRSIALDDSRSRRHRHRHRHQNEGYNEKDARLSPTGHQKSARSKYVSGSQDDEVEPRRADRHHRTIEDKQVIASGDNITVKVNFSNNDATSRSSSSSPDTSPSKSRADWSPGQPRESFNDDDIIILSSPSSSSSCSVYTVADESDADVSEFSQTLEAAQKTPLEDEPKSDEQAEVRKVVLEDESAENNAGPSGIKVVVSCESNAPTTSVEAPRTETAISASAQKADFAAEKYDPFEPTNSPTSSDDMANAPKAVPPLPELPPLPPEPPEEVADKPALPKDDQVAEQRAHTPHSIITPPTVQSNWPVNTAPPRLPNIHEPPPNHGRPPLLVPPISPSLFTRPPPSLNSGPIRIIPPAALPSIRHPPPNMIPKLGHSLNIPPPNIVPNIPIEMAPHMASLQASSAFNRSKKEGQDVTDVVDMELDTSPHSVGDNRHISPAKPPGMQNNGAPKLNKNLKMDSLLLSLVASKQILHSLAKSAVQGSSAKKGKAHVTSQQNIFNQLLKSQQQQQSVSNKQKHAKTKNPRKTGPRTPESDTNEPPAVKHSRGMSASSADDKKKAKSGKYSGMNVNEDLKKGINVKIGEDHLQILDDVPSSAVEMQVKEKFLKKLNRQERVIEEVKLALKPYYHKRDINKDDYKEIMRKAVPKICHNKTGEINPVRIKSLIEGYVKRSKHQRKKKSAMPSSTT